MAVKVTCIYSTQSCISRASIHHCQWKQKGIFYLQQLGLVWNFNAQLSPATFPWCLQTHMHVQEGLSQTKSHNCNQCAHTSSRANSSPSSVSSAAVYSTLQQIGGLPYAAKLITWMSNKMLHHTTSCPHDAFLFMLCQSLKVLSHWVSGLCDPYFMYQVVKKRRQRFSNY